MVGRRISGHGAEIGALAAVMCILIAGCAFETDSCLRCHTDQELLQEIAEEIEVVESSGDG